MNNQATQVTNSRSPGVTLSAETRPFPLRIEKSPCQESAGQLHLQTKSVALLANVGLVFHRAEFKSDESLCKRSARQT